MTNNRVEFLMEKLQCTQAEAEQIILDDKAIDRGEKMYYDLPPEKAKNVKKYTHVGTRSQSSKNVANSSKRKENPIKTAIISELSDFMTQKGYENIQILNETRQFSFQINGKTYEITLVEKKK